MAYTGIGTTDDVYTANGTAVGPSFQPSSASGAVTTIDGDAGSATPAAGVITISGGTTGLTTAASGSTVDLTGTLVVANGGTGDASFTTYAPVCGGTTATGALQSASTGISTSGFVLTSTGAASCRVGSRFRQQGLSQPSQAIVGGLKFRRRGILTSLEQEA